MTHLSITTARGAMPGDGHVSPVPLCVVVHRFTCPTCVCCAGLRFHGQECDGHLGRVCCRTAVCRAGPCLRVETDGAWCVVLGVDDWARTFAMPSNVSFSSLIEFEISSRGDAYVYYIGVEITAEPRVIELFLLLRRYVAGYHVYKYSEE